MGAMILVHGSLVGPSSLEPTASELRKRGWTCHAPSLSGLPDTIISWADWPARLVKRLPEWNEPSLLVTAWVADSPRGSLVI